MKRRGVPVDSLKRRYLSALFAAFLSGFAGQAVFAQNQATKAADPWAVFLSGGKFEGTFRSADKRPELNPNYPYFLRASSRSDSPVTVISTYSDKAVTIFIRDSYFCENCAQDLEKVQLTLLGNTQDTLFRQDPKPPLLPFAVDAQAQKSTKNRLSDWLKNSETAENLPVDAKTITRFLELFREEAANRERTQREFVAKMNPNAPGDPLRSPAWGAKYGLDSNKWGVIGYLSMKGRDNHLVVHSMDINVGEKQLPLSFEYVHDLDIKPVLTPGDILEEDISFSIGEPQVKFRLYTWQQLCPPCTGNEPVEIGTLTVHLAE